MFQLSFGIMSIALALVFPVIYLVGHGARRLDSYLHRKSPPGERVGWFIAIAVIFGLLAGSLLQPKWEKMSICHEDGYSYTKCFMPAFSS